MENNEMTLEIGSRRWPVSTVAEAIALCPDAKHIERVPACDDEGEWEDYWLYASQEDAKGDWHGREAIGVIYHATGKIKGDEDE